MTTIYEFVEGRYEIHSEFSRKIIEEIQVFYGEKTDEEFEKLKKKLNNKGIIRLKYADFPGVIKAKFEAFNVSVTKVLESSHTEITEYFRFLQNQERLRAGEILNSLADSKMEKYLLEIKDLDCFCRIIGFDNERKEFDKLFYNIIGLMDNKVSLGVPDSIIKKYVTTIDTITAGKEEVERLLRQINQISEQFKGEKILTASKKRYVKFLMMLMGFGLVDFTEDTEKKLKALGKIDNKLSVFFSSKPGVVTEEFTNYTNEVIEEFRAIALISKGAQTLERVKNRMEILAYYVENIQEKQKISGITVI